MISNDVLTKIDDETDIVSLVSEFISLEKRGKNYMGLCPFHDENTPSFSVNPEKNIAMCMGCGEGGRPINFYRRIKNISLAESAKILGEKIGIEINVTIDKSEIKNKVLYEMMAEASNFYEYNLTNSKSGEVVLNYLYSRGLTDETIKQFKLGFSSKDRDQLYQFLKSLNYSVSDMINLGLVKQAEDGTYYDLFINRLMFPITDIKGRVIAFSARALEKNEKIKYINSPETLIFKKGETVYNLSEAGLEIRKMKSAILFEGFFDVISSYQAGVKNGIATMGTALTSNQANLIKKTTDKIITAYDGDSAGVKATISAIPLLLRSRLQVESLQLPVKMDPDDFIKQNGKDEYIKLLETKVVDPYQYQYEHYLSNLDLNNANDLNTFQNNITKMLKTATPAIVSLYKKKMADELNINQEDIYIPVAPPEEPVYYDDYVPNFNDYVEPTYQKRQPSTSKDIVLPTKQPTKKLDNKYVQAETELIILMTRSTEWAEIITEKLKSDEYSILVLSMIRIKLKGHLEFNKGFDLTLFKEELNHDELKYFDEKICKSSSWVNKNILEEKIIYQYIDLLKITPHERRIQYLLDLMIEKGEQNKDISEQNEEYILLKKKIANLREEVSNGKSN